jgi:diacylglycerol kinase (ATP)
VFNPTKVDEARLKKTVNDAAIRAGWARPRWYPTTVDDPGQLLTRTALSKGAELVLAAGGDGTVRAVADELRGTSVALGIIPSGTGNILARNLSLPLNNLEAAAEIAFATEERSIDVGVATLTDADGSDSEHAFLVMAGLGLDAALIANTNSVLKSRVGWLAYVDAGVRTLPTLSKVRLRFSVGPAPERSAHVSGILVANCGSLPGNIQLFPDALIDDGELDVAVLQPKTFLGWLMIWRKITWENRILRRTSLGRRYIQLTTEGRETVISYLRGGAVALAVDEPAPFEIDGDDFGVVTAVLLTIDPAALRVKVR